MSRLILVRHAAPVIEPSRPSAEWFLSAEGRAAAVALSARLMHYAPAIVLSGTEPKLAGTAEIIAQAASVPAVLIPGLSEHARRSSVFGTKAEFEKSIRRLFDEPEKLVYGDESANAMYERFSAALDNVLGDYEGRTVVAVSGGTAISLFISRRSGMPAFPLWQSLQMPTAFVIARGDWKVQEILYS